MISLIIADDHRMFIDGIYSIVGHEKDIEIIGNAGDGEELLQLLKLRTPDVLLMDINMPNLNGVEATRLVKESYSSVKILVISMHNSYAFVSSLIELGVDGYLLKNTGRHELIAAIRILARGGTSYDPEVTKTLIEGMKRGREEEQVRITSREKEVMELIAREFTTEEIAGQLFISPHTVESHRKNILSKIGAKNSAGIVRYAIEHGIYRA